MKINIKSLYSDANYLDLLQFVNSMNLDAFGYNDIIKQTVFDLDKISDGSVYAQQTNNRKTYIKAMEKLHDLYASYQSDYPTEIEFVKDMFNCLKNEFSKYVLKSDNSLPNNQLTQQQTTYYENLKKEYIDVLPHSLSTDISVNLICYELNKRPISELVNFIDMAEAKVALEMKNTTPTPERRNVLEFILYQHFANSSHTIGNGIIAQKIEINKAFLAPTSTAKIDLNQLLNVASFLSNYICLDKANMLSQNIGFNGYQFFDTNTDTSISSTSQNMHKTNLKYAERSAQSNFVLNETMAKALLSLPKRRMDIRRKPALRYTTTENGQKIKVTKTLYRPSFPTADNLHIHIDVSLNLGYFVKVKRVNTVTKTYEIMLFYFCDKDLQHGIQLFRLDKVEDTFKGQPASHILRGGEKINSTLHTHTYNQIDATIKNIDKDSALGNMDLSHNFITANDISLNIAEEMFNNSCGIINSKLWTKNRNKIADLIYHP